MTQSLYLQAKKNIENDFTRNPYKAYRKSYSSPI